MLGDIPSRSYGYKAKWHFVNDIDFLAYFNKTFPLPAKNSWTGFRLTNEVAVKVTLELLMQGSPMAEWRRLPKLGRKFGPSGRPIAEMSECLRTWTTATSEPLPESQPCSAAASEKASEEKLSPLVQFAPGSAVSTRQSLWTQAANRSINGMASTT